MMKVSLVCLAGRDDGFVWNRMSEAFVGVGMLAWEICCGDTDLGFMLLSVLTVRVLLTPL